MVWILHQPRSLRAGLLIGKLVSVWTAGRGHSPQRTASSPAETRSFRSRGVSVCALRKAPRLLPAFSEDTVGHLEASPGPAPPCSCLSPGHGVTAPSGPESPASPSAYPWLLPSLKSCVQLLPSAPTEGGALLIAVGTWVELTPPLNGLLPPPSARGNTSAALQGPWTGREGEGCACLLGCTFTPKVLFSLFL